MCNKTKMSIEQVPSQTSIPRWQWFVTGVLSGNIKVCELVRLACQRHVDDLKRSESTSWPYKFSEARAKYVLDFFETRLVLTKGMRKPTPFVPEPWQQFIIVSLFGWIRKDDSTRRFRKGNIAVPRKNGKSHLLAGIGLYGLRADGEYGAEVYTAATKKDQAKMIFDAAVEFRKNNDRLKQDITFRNSTLSFSARGSKFQALSSDEDGLDGLNVHLGLIDEYQNHKTDTVRSRIQTGTGQRLQPLVLTIGTAGTEVLSPMGREHDVSIRILRREADDDTYFVFISEADETDEDWESENLWAKVNLNLGISKTWEYMRSEAQGARNDPSKLNDFKRLDLNQWTQQEYVYLPMNRWRLCVGDVKTVKDGQSAIVDIKDRAAVEDAMLEQWRLPYGGLDLSSKHDITAMVLLFPLSKDDPRYVITCRFWVPQDGVALRVKNDKVPYDEWIRQGLITPTPGEVVDYSFIEEELIKLHQKLHFQGIGYDPWNAIQLTSNLKSRGMQNLIEVQQGYKTLSDPTKELLAWTLSKKIAHLNHPVLNWMARNMAVTKDPTGSVKPDKSKARERMDGMSALVNAIRVAITREQSVYSNRGIVTI